MVVFTPQSHQYFNDYTGEEYISSSGVLAQFKPKFDSDKWSKIVADREKVSQAEILARWDKIKTDACTKGTNIHKLIEVYFTENLNDGSVNLGNFIKLFDTIRVNRSKINAEKLVYNHQYKIAGTSDIIEDCGSYFNVYDYKTNARFRYTNKYNEYMLEPMCHLLVCEYNTYSLQLSLYAYMYSMMTGKHIGRLGVFHHDNGNWQLIPIIYLKDSVEKLLPLIKH